MHPSKNRILLTLSLLFLLASACQPQTPAIDQNTAMTQAVQTAFASIQQTQTASSPTVTNTPLPTPTQPPRTPPALPPVYSSSSLNPLDTPHTYISNACQYLKSKWDPANSAPGTIVIVIMFHGIEKATTTVSDPKNISSKDFQLLMNDLHNLGFQAISTQQLSDFMYTNAKIPLRSALLVVDDRHQAQNYITWFLPYWNQWKWPVINGWISAFGGSDPFLAQNVDLAKQGWVDYQAHGVVHNIPISDSSSDAYIHSELFGSVQNLQQYFSKTPIAYIWPGGGFTPKAVQVARQAGYKLGFTINPRGPLMFNWVPLADAQDPQRPYDIPEGPSNDPLMTLPRFWDVDARNYLDTVRLIGNNAADYAQQNKATELDYYNIVCAPNPEYGPLPTAAPQ